MLRLFNGILALFTLIYDLFGFVGVAALFGVLGVGIWALWRYGGELFFWLLYRNFREHGRVLRDAQVQIHSLLPAPEPAPDEDDFECEQALEEAGMPDEPEFRHFYLETTITPRQDPKTLKHPEDGWHPTSLMLVEAGRDKVELMEIDGAGFIQDGWVIRNQQLVPYLDQVCHGPARLKLHISVRPDCRRLRFLYMQEIFGDIAIPAQSPAQVAR